MSDITTDEVKLQALDFDPVVECSFPEHQKGKYGHVPDTEASWYHQCPECMAIFLACSGAKRWFMRNFQPLSVMECLVCNEYFFTASLIWTPIRGVW